ncbi:MAG: hypothetical protein GVY19_04555 [Bacteroidetes bacterium]|jgi:gluconate 2-dehydrogenase gamma chain|nr:hypothetical protein [Bacteroidota bacterium]
MKPLKRSHITRRLFIKQSSVFSAIGSFTLSACQGVFTKKNKNTGSPFTEYDKTTLRAVFNHLLPSDYPDSPGANDVNVLGFLKRTMQDPYFDSYDKRIIFNGVRWIQETAIDMFDNYFHALSDNDKEAALRDLETYSNGEHWLSMMLTYIFEALLSDPVYGGNTDQLGWRWLNHQPGYPRPIIEKTYDKL